jgi:hypothetical protein|tara:strand:- start:87 stop:305 length:219 start_codon:yes stop_codon:yes gene_type:complete
MRDKQKIKLDGVNDPNKVAGSLCESTSRAADSTRLMMLIGAINSARVVVEDPDVKLMLTNILRAGGVFADDD